MNEHRWIFQLSQDTIAELTVSGELSNREFSLLKQYINVAERALDAEYNCGYPPVRRERAPSPVATDIAPLATIATSEDDTPF